ncbi:MAG: thioredoxin fold domain-containing protein [Proteobacteria bacterium]|nr:thioredoxin fold domain-containing protein [Pseudomonadota bacterium]
MRYSTPNNPPLLSLLLFIIASVGMLQLEAKTEGDLDDGMVNPGHEEKPGWFKVSFLDLFEDIEDAADNNKRLMIYYYQDGCPYCKKLLEDNFSQREIAEKTQKYFDVVAINLWGDKDVTVGDKVYTEKKFAEALKVQYTPTLLFFDEDKKIIFRANGYYPPEKFSALLDYIGTRQEKKLSYQQYMEEHDPQPASGRLHDAINSIASDDLSVTRLAASGKPLLVMFEQAKCNTCDELHLDILKREQSKQLLSHFNVVVLNMWSTESIITPDGKKQKIREWANKLDIKYAPSLLFFNKQGAEVFRTDAYLKAFHTQSAMDYVSSDAYKAQSNFQRYIDERADHLREQGIDVNLMD